ncbi:MAG: hypothetical protein M1817_005394 [Caeruleum heppii]|nr:MAG: hypothetical protein M1817_005394 [Caeruleum heppii]
MVQLTSPLPSFPLDLVSLYSATDPRLSESPILVYHGPSTTTNTSQNNARIQAHIFGPAGFLTYPRITISPGSSLYAAVRHLPRDQQGDEVCRGLAVSLFKYFTDLSDQAKEAWCAASRASSNKVPAQSASLFNDVHAAEVASRMTRTAHAAQVFRDLQSILRIQCLSTVEVDVVLPPKSIHPIDPRQSDRYDSSNFNDDPSSEQYGRYASLVRLFGPSTFLPTSKLRRAPSKPTNLNKNKTFTKTQKESVRREFWELLDTEERYVDKVKSLVTDVAQSFRRNPLITPTDARHEFAATVDKLFPPCLDQILNVNLDFLAAIRTVVEETEDEALQDIEADATLGSPESRTGKRARRRDATGSLALSNVLLEWFPRLSTCYPQYMRASTGFSNLLNVLSKDPRSASASLLKQHGEQRLRSMLIEPVQRLPRYSLVIDSITSQLPACHPALHPLLKARDLITQICALEGDSPAELSNSLDRLRSLISSWPASLRPQGRLIAAADCVELSSPYHADRVIDSNRECIVLLFAEYVVLVQRSRESSLTARGLVAELDRPSPEAMAASVAAATHDQSPSQGLTFSTSNRLDAVDFTESVDGNMIWMIPVKHESAGSAPALSFGNHSYARIQVLKLSGSYEGKASRWSEDIAKARVEARFSERERESERWELRSLSGNDCDPIIYAAVFEGGRNEFSEARCPPAMVQIRVDGASSEAKDGRTGIIVDVTLRSTNAYSITWTAFDGTYWSIDVSESEFRGTMTRTLSKLLTERYKIEYVAPLIDFNAAAIRTSGACGAVREVAHEKPSLHRPPSPVKLLSNFFTGGSIREQASPVKHRNPVLEKVPTLNYLPPKPPASTLHGAKVDPAASNITLVPSNGSGQPTVPSIGLEETLSTYVLALHGRRGNVVERSLRGRSVADELLVNEVYNALLEDPSKHSPATEVSVDVLFAAFEKFLHKAWRSKMGPVVAIKTLNIIMNSMSTMTPPVFESHFKKIMDEMPAPNQRAFKAAIKLLADLLDGSGSDGDRGALTAAMAELLVADDDPHAYIPLLDRLVEDYDRLFDDDAPFDVGGTATPYAGSVTSSTRSRAVNTGSLSSNASSLRKRFGLTTLHRENSTNEPESKVSSVWRSLSKTARGATAGYNTAASVSKASLVRSKSTDVDVRSSPVQRPVTRERPTVLGSFDFEPLSRPSSSHTPGGHGSAASSRPASRDAPLPPKKKRRSSLSDLKAWQDPMAPSPVGQEQMRSGPSAYSPVRAPSPIKRSSPPRTPSPSKRIPMPSPSRAIANRKENSPAQQPRGTLLERNNNIQSDEVVMTEYRALPKPTSPSAIPVLKGGLRERPRHTPVESPTRRGVGSPQKLRVQSPQKLREKLQSEHKAITDVSQSLQAEMFKIGEEISQIGRGTSSSAASSRSSRYTSTTPHAPPVDPHQLADRVSSLESRLTSAIADLTRRTTALQTDFESRLALSESKAKKLDELYREANAENEALYDRFNEELGKLSRAVRPAPEGSGGRANEGVLLQKVRDGSEEVGRLKVENARLKREVVGLRSALVGP